MLYTKIKALESEVKELTKLGVIDPCWERNIRIVESFYKLRDLDVCVSCAHEFIAKEEGISASSVKKVIARMTSK